MKLKKKAMRNNVFIYCKTKKEVKKLMKAAKKSLSLSFIHEKSTAVFEYEPDENFFELKKEKCYYNLFYRKIANKDIMYAAFPDAKVIPFKKAVK